MIPKFFTQRYRKVKIIRTYLNIKKLATCLNNFIKTGLNHQPLNWVKLKLLMGYFSKYIYLQKQIFKGRCLYLSYKL